MWRCYAQKMNWEGEKKKSLLDFLSGLKLTFSSYECIHLHVYSKLRDWEWCVRALASSRLLSSHLLSRLKTRLVRRGVGSAGLYRGWMFPLLFWLRTDGSSAPLCTEGNWLFLRSPLSSQPHICRSPLGPISSGRGEAAGHSISSSPHAFPARSPFFFSSPKPEETTSANPPARRKWVTDDPWTFPRGRSVAGLQGHWHKLSALAAVQKPDSKQLWLWFFSESIIYFSQWDQKYKRLNSLLSL